MCSGGVGTFSTLPCRRGCPQQGTIIISHLGSPGSAACWCRTCAGAAGFNSSTELPETGLTHAPASGRVCEITNGRFVDAKQEKQWLAVRPLWSDPAGEFGSAASVRKPEDRSLAGSCVVSRSLIYKIEDEGALPMQSGRLRLRTLSGGYRLPPAFVRQISTAAPSLKRYYPPPANMLCMACPREFSTQCLRTETLNEGASGSDRARPPAVKDLSLG
jgi:hypothetical protein